MSMIHRIGFLSIPLVRYFNKEVFFSRNDTARVVHVEHPNHDEHQRSVENVDIDLCGLKGAIRTGDILDDSEYRADHDESTGYIEDEDIPLPGAAEGETGARRIGNDASVEDERYYHEKSEEDDLNAEPTNNNILATILIIECFRICKHASAFTKTLAQIVSVSNESSISLLPPD